MLDIWITYPTGYHRHVPDHTPPGSGEDDRSTGTQRGSESSWEPEQCPWCCPRRRCIADDSAGRARLRPQIFPDTPVVTVDIVLVVWAMVAVRTERLLVAK
jgi:hypothetical protein